MLFANLLFVVINLCIKFAASWQLYTHLHQLILALLCICICMYVYCCTCCVFELRSSFDQATIAISFALSSIRQRQQQGWQQ